MQTITAVLGIGAALLHGTAYVLYNLQSKSGKSQPNVISVGIWVFLSALNAFVFKEVSAGVVVTLQFFVGALGSFGTFVYVLRIGKFRRPANWEWSVLVLGILAGVLWLFFHSAAMANMIILIAILISCVPIWVGVLRDPFKESPLAWILWASAFVITSVNVALRWLLSDGSPVAIIMPVTLVVAHGIVAIWSRPSRKRGYHE